MPIYEYYCPDCRRRVSVFFRSFAAVGAVACPECGGERLERRFSRVVVRRGGSRDAETPAELDTEGGMGNELSDYGNFGAGGFDDAGPGDDADPRELARWARQMSAEIGEPLDAEMDSALADMERGADPEEILSRFDEPDGEG